VGAPKSPRPSPRERPERDPNSDAANAPAHSKEIAGWQRARLIDAAIDVSREREGRVTATAIIVRAGVSRKTFYDLFDDTEDCMLAVLDNLVERFEAPLRLAYESQAGWLEGIRAAVALGLRSLDDDRALARIVLLDSLSAGPRILARRGLLLEELAGAITPPQGPGAPPLPLATAGGILELLAHRLLSEPLAPLSELYGAIVSVVVLPHEGRHAAAREFALAPPDVPAVPASGEGASAARHALHLLRTRLTYRTVRVLDALAVAPGASNRRVAEAAGVADAGQISKLLKRLAALGLAENRGAGQPNGAANSWYLTADGTAIQRSAGGARMLAPRR
jgi:AcrR family transcriptional regulator